MNTGIKINLTDKREKDESGNYIGEEFLSEGGLVEFVNYLDVSREKLIPEPIYMEGEKVRTHTNNSGGVQGGISNGEPILFRVAFKPTATIMSAQPTVSKDREDTELKGRGRHDACVLPRAVPIVEAMTNLILCDHLLRHRALCES